VSSKTTASSDCDGATAVVEIRSCFEPPASHTSAIRRPPLRAPHAQFASHHRDAFACAAKGLARARLPRSIDNGPPTTDKLVKRRWKKRFAFVARLTINTIDIMDH
jgi:hypothetical protein